METEEVKETITMPGNGDKKNKKNDQWKNDFIAEMKEVNKSIEVVRAKYGVVSGISSAWIFDRFTLCIDLGDLVSVL